MPRSAINVAMAVMLAASLAGCEYGMLLRPGVLKQLDPDVAALVNELPEVDHPNKAILARLFVHGGLTQASVGSDGVMRTGIHVPLDEMIWKPSVIALPQGGELHLDIDNNDDAHHMAFMPSNGARQLLDLPPKTRGRVVVHLSQPGLYWFGCPVAVGCSRISTRTDTCSCSIVNRAGWCARRGSARASRGATSTPHRVA